MNALASLRPTGRRFGFCRAAGIASIALATGFLSGGGAAALAQTTQATPGPQTILFIGNSFTYGDKSPVHYFRPDSVADLNGEGIGGVPALFKSFTQTAGMDYAVSLETAGGKGLDFHFQSKASVIGKSWDVVVMHGFSTLDAQKPGDPALLIQSAGQVAQLLHDKNPKVSVRLMATWSRADQTYLPSGHWHGQPIDAMGKDIRAGYDRAAAGSPAIQGVIPVGEAWNRAIAAGFADANPYDGIDAKKVDLWAYDNYHGSTFGYYLEALTVFGNVTGMDPRSLGKSERCASELGVSPDQAAAMQQIAYDQLIASGSKDLKTFTPQPARSRRTAPQVGRGGST